MKGGLDKQDVKLNKVKEHRQYQEQKEKDRKKEEELEKKKDDA